MIRAPRTTMWAGAHTNNVSSTMDLDALFDEPPRVLIPGALKLRDAKEHVCTLMAKAARGCPVKVATIGTSGCGKSTLVNALASTVASMFTYLSDAGNGYGDGGQRSLAMRTYPLLRMLLEDPDSLDIGDFEYVLMDMVGHRNLQELATTLTGRVRSGEMYPKETELDRFGELMQRLVKPKDAASLGIVLVPANVLHSLVDPPPYVMDAITAARQYKANTKENHVLPLVLLITRVDEWVPAKGKDAMILLERDGILEPLLRKAGTWGFQGNLTFAMGYLDQGTIDFSNAEDPRVVALKNLLILTSRTASLFQREWAN